MTNAIDFLAERGFINQATFPLHNPPKTINAYIGFDLTAPSLHVGSLIQIMVLKHLKDHGHKVTVLLGRATSRVGDPSGKSKERKMLSDQEIGDNFNGIKKIITKLVGNCIVTNDSWFNHDLSFMEFLTTFGTHFSINKMMALHSVKSRLDDNKNLSFLEFCYSLMQAVDFHHLNETFGVNVQIGGSDQWGNIVSGIDLIRRMNGNEVFAFTTPLLLDKNGEKMGKSQGNPVWLDAEMTSPFDFFQFWRNIDDADVDRFTKLFTPLMGANRDPNVAKEELAFHVTSLVHGKQLAEETREQVRNAFSGTIGAVSKSAVSSGTIVETMVNTGLSPSKKEARRLIANNAVSVDGIKVSEDGILENGILRVGKKEPIHIEKVL